ncbi:cell division protein FtsL [Thiomicrospira microaerophila]|uniref:cell division protein FtsL n=1 Tax=Thiomicrospira microaerophila TaxID=406020 RepID=UPI0005CB4550|nr:cell division protein FtsL [Thiomicrospira microaerophila]
MQVQKPIREQASTAHGLFAFLLLCLLSALIGITILLQHHIRHLETQIFNATQAKAQLDEEWGRLMLEKSHLSAPGRVESMARDKLGMQASKPTTILVLPHQQKSE